MAENQIKIEVAGKVATLKEQNFELVGGNDDYKVIFDFDEGWNAYAVKTAVFVFGDSSVKKIFTGNVCDGVPISNATGCFIGVFVGSKATTTAAYVECNDYSITDISGKPADPSKSVYDQLIELFNKVIEEEAIKAISPTVNVEPIENGNRVTITDINDTHSFDVMNGEKGEQGEAGKDGKDYVLTDADKTEIAEKVDADFDKKVSEIESEVEELKESKLNSAGISHSCSESGDTVSLDICAGGVVLRADQSRGSITIGGTDGHNPISIYSDSIAGIPYDDIARKGKVEALETQNTILKKRVDNIEGAAIDFVVDSTDAVTKTVPTDALPYAKIMKIGGKTVVEDVPFEGFILKSAPVTELVVEGANLIPFPYKEGGAGSVIEKTGVTFTINSDGSITVNGTSTGYATLMLSSNVAFKAGETYTRTPDVTGISFVISYYEAGATQYLSTGTFTWGAGWTLKNAFLQVNPGNTINNVTFYPIINKGSTSLPYRPYSKRTFPIPESVRPLNGINANACDYIAWEADGTRKKYKCIAIVDASSLVWYYDSSTNVFYTASLNNEKATGSTNVLCTRYETATVSWANMGDKMIAGASGDSVLRIKDTEYGSDLTSFRNSLAGVQIAYEMKTHTVTDISNVLTSDNYIEVDGGGTITAVNGGKGAPTTIYYATEKTGG